MSNEQPVPYFVLNIGGGKSKALFSVPPEQAEILIKHPILCRGSCFDLSIDTKDEKATFLATEYISPDPESTASEISRRLANRVANPSFPDSSQLMFGR